MRATRYTANMFNTRRSVLLGPACCLCSLCSHPDGYTSGRWTRMLEAGMQMGWEVINRGGKRGSATAAANMHVIPFDRNE